MVSRVQVQESLPQNSIFDSLYCEEERFDEDFNDGPGLKEPETEDFNGICRRPFGFLLDHDLLWEDEEIVTLLSKEKNQVHLNYDDINSDGTLEMARSEAINWMLKVIGHYGFTAMSAFLAVNYYDRFITSLCFQRDKPWMSQLAAVACLSVAAKVEETQVPLLLDIQVAESKYVFEAKTIQRMELLVLSTLQWKMHPVTPISFLDHIVRRFELIKNLHWEFLNRCESVVLSVITDCRFARYLPSVMAAATMEYVIREIGTCDALECENQIMGALRTSEEKIEDCHNLIVEIMDDPNCKLGRKRKLEPIPSSPSGVIDAYFSSDSSDESWAVSSSPEPLSKRSRTQEHHIRLAAAKQSVCWSG